MATASPTFAPAHLGEFPVVLEVRDLAQLEGAFRGRGEEKF